MVLISILIMILVIALSSLRITAIYFNRIAIILLLYSGVLAYNTLYTGPVGSGVGVFGGLFQVTTITQSMDVFIYLVGALVLLLGENSTLISKGKGLPVLAEYPLIVLFTVLGMSCLISSSDLVSMFLSIELQSFAVYILATIYRESESATSAGLKYFLLGSLSSALILLGSSLLYGFTGLTTFDSLYLLCSTTSTNHYIELGVLLMAMGLLFKVSAAPFHWPFPSIYSGVPTVVTAALSTLPKLSVFIFLFEFHQIFQSSVRIDLILLIAGLLSLILGSLSALTQFNIKHLLAYSSISNVGFILLALSTSSVIGLEASLFYLIQYTLTNVNVFLMLVSMGNLLDSPVSKGSPLLFIKQLSGLFQLFPLLGLSFAVSLFSLMGIPPFVGFFAKLEVLLALLFSGSYFVAVLVILFSVLSASYYLQIIRVIHFDFLYTAKNNFNSNGQINTAVGTAIACITLLMLFFLLNPTPLLNSLHLLTLHYLVYW
jgi:NADH-ubiquinone oxidoreductase chain 2